MRRNKGFTLVELLVVMAIIAILAAIAIPNVQRWILKGRATQAISEISNIELAMTKILSDAGRSSISDLIDPDGFNGELMARNASLPNPPTTDTWTDTDFDNAVEIYTNVMYALLRAGRGIMSTTDAVGEDSGLLLVREDVVRNLGTAYMSELGTDPWGNLYQFYPGPWPARNGLPVFRVYLPPAANAVRLPGDPDTGVVPDDLSLVDGVNGVTLIDPDTGDPMAAIGVPANTRKDVFIWSNGANLISGQARYSAPTNPADPPDGQYTPSDLNNYEAGQEPEQMGGGDDINNWDKDQTFMRFYN